MSYHGDRIPEEAVDTMVQRVTGMALMYGRFRSSSV